MKNCLSNIKNYMLYMLWLIRNKPYPPTNILYKRKRIAEFGKKYSCEILIESGTHEGKTVLYEKKYFNRIISIEVYEPLYVKAKKRTEKIKNIKLWHGKSENILPQILNTIDGKILFWLDGHYSGDGTGKGNSNCPVMKELEAIMTHRRKDHIILIDDAREFNGTNEYPTLEEVKNKILKINPEYKIEISYDCIMAYL